ncbi:MAG: hypothetical protein AB2724_14090 [Candidatus Thiodiazotropha sp.]
MGRAHPASLSSSHPSRHRLELYALVLASVLGVLVYILERDPATVYLMPDVIGSLGLWGVASLPFSGQIPEFVHVYICILLTALVLDRTLFIHRSITLAWFLFDFMAEMAQHPEIAASISDRIPRWFSDVPVLQNTQSYLLGSTFDPLDLLFIFLGSIAAYLTLTFSNRLEGPRHV